MTQKETGDKVGILPKTVSAIENTPGGSTIDTFFKLLSAYPVLGNTADRLNSDEAAGYRESVNTFDG